jgi:nucleotide-binding universal stress UspA family protein
MKILLPVDGSADALAAVRHALALVRDGLQAEFVLVNVQEPASLYEMVVAHDPDVIVHVRSEAGADLLSPAEALLEAAGLSYESEVAGGQPVTVLVELLENYGCDAVVMGARGAGSGSGSVAMAMLQRSPVPVTLVRAPALDEPAAERDAAEG